MAASQLDSYQVGVDDHSSIQTSYLDAANVKNVPEVDPKNYIQSLAAEGIQAE